MFSDIGKIIEMEWNDKSSLMRRRTIFKDDQYVHSYTDKNMLDYGSRMIYHINSNTEKGEVFENKWHGYFEVSYSNGDKEVGRMFNGEEYGEFKMISKNGDEKIVRLKD